MNRKTLKNFRLDHVMISLILAGGLAVLGFFISHTILNGRVGVNTATVKGLSERIVESNIAEIEISLGESLERMETVLPPDELEALYKDSENEQQSVMEVLQFAGITQEEITQSPLQYALANEYRYDENGNYVEAEEYRLRTVHNVSGTIHVRSQHIDQIEKTYLALLDLNRKGIDIGVEAPKYLFTDLNAIKPDMLREATENARIAADEFAKNANVRVGGIQDATQGGFSIEDVGDPENDTLKRQKIVRVVTTITFYLDN